MGKERDALGIAVMQVNSSQFVLNCNKYELQLLAQELEGDLKIDLLFKADTLEEARYLLYSLEAIEFRKNQLIIVVKEGSEVYALVHRKLEGFLLVSNETVRLPNEGELEDLLHKIIDQKDDKAICAKIDALNEQSKQCKDKEQGEQLQKAINAYKRLLKLSNATEKT